MNKTLKTIFAIIVFVITHEVAVNLVPGINCPVCLCSNAGFPADCSCPICTSTAWDTLYVYIWLPLLIAAIVTIIYVLAVNKFVKSTKK